MSLTDFEKKLIENTSNCLKAGVSKKHLSEKYEEEKIKQQILCEVCKNSPSIHTVGDRRLCCKCYVREGNPPADWHQGCMDAYKESETKNV